MKPLFAVFAKTDQERLAAASRYLDVHGLSRAVYVCPANRAALARAHFGHDADVRVFPFEDLTKPDPYLGLNAFVDDRTAMILDGSIRYNKVSSSKFKPIHHLCRQTPYRLVLDIAPFHGAIRSIYFPFSYLDRAILGYQHWYAFRPNNLEEAVNGEPVEAHDAALIAGKVAPHSAIAYQRLLASQRRWVECVTTPEEEARYAARREELFATHKTPGPIVTRLADTTHAFESRMTVFRDLVSELSGSVLALTNLADAKHAGSARKARFEALKAGREVTARSYYDDCADVAAFDHVVYLESPIVNSHLLLDVEARVRPDAQVWHFTADAKVDVFLSSRIREEMTVMNEFAAALWSAIHDA